MAKTKKYFEIWQHNIVRHLKEMHTRDMAKKQKNILKFCNIAFSRDMAKKQKKIFFKFCKIALCGIQNNMAKKRKQIFLKLSNVALCGIQNRCIRAYSKPFIFIRSRDTAKKRKKIPRYGKKTKKNIFEIWQHNIVRHLKEMHTYGQKTKINIFEIWQQNIVRKCIRAYFKLSIFTSSRDMAKKQKNIFKFCKIALCGIQNTLCGIQNRCIRAYFKPFIFIRSRDTAKKRKKIVFKFGNMTFFYFHQQPRYGQKQKNIFEFCNIALCGIQNRCIRAYSKPFIFIRSRDMAKNEKNILKLCNVALCGIQNRCIRAYSKPLYSSAAEIWPKTKKYF
ncbi:hypothetical protein PUN28_002153 [Cardiocondyla obscurior]|uniref:Ribosomal protein S7 n=1 Tax=Cardiocondyla obscurior TaxID=286306 RepID=A0AAW2GSY1_9HYME